ncbi:uncharacterized protein [Apostichopus japonicus]|uniref:uncharacterized protein n=1 Tax=Stichopus japonicus TaxID=307972 RepID=UPI003AB80484
MAKPNPAEIIQSLPSADDDREVGGSNAHDKSTTFARLPSVFKESFQVGEISTDKAQTATASTSKNTFVAPTIKAGSVCSIAHVEMKSVINPKNSSEGGLDRPSMKPKRVKKRLLVSDLLKGLDSQKVPLTKIDGGIKDNNHQIIPIPCGEDQIENKGPLLPCNLMFLVGDTSITPLWIPVTPLPSLGCQSPATASNKGKRKAEDTALPNPPSKNTKTEQSLLRRDQNSNQQIGRTNLQSHPVAIVPNLELKTVEGKLSSLKEKSSLPSNTMLTNPSLNLLNNKTTGVNSKKANTIYSMSSFRKALLDSNSNEVRDPVNVSRRMPAEAQRENSPVLKKGPVLPGHIASGMKRSDENPQGGCNSSLKGEETPAGTSMKMFMVSDRHGNTRCVRAPSWMTSSTILSIIMRTRCDKSSPADGPKPKPRPKNNKRNIAPTSWKVRTRLRTGTIAPVCWGKKFNKPCARSCCVPKRRKKATVSKAKLKDKPKVTRELTISQRLAILKENIASTSKFEMRNQISSTGDDKTQEIAATGARELPSVSATKDDRKPERKVSLPSIHLNPISVENSDSPRLNLHKEDTNVEASPRDKPELTNQCPSPLDSDSNGLKDLADIKKGSEAEGGLYTSDGSINTSNESVHVKVEANLEINNELSDDTELQMAERNDLRCETGLELTEIPSDFSLMRGKDRIKMLRERMKKREKEIEELIRNQPKIEENI